MSQHLYVINTHPVNAIKTEFLCWYDEGESKRGDYAGRAVFVVSTGCAALHTHLSLSDCRALAANLTAMADAIEADTGEQS